VNVGDTVYFMKYALTAGIIEAVVDSQSEDKKYVFLKSKQLSNSEPNQSAVIARINGDVFSDRNNAIKAAEKMRDKKIKSLKEQITKLEKLKF